MAINMPWPNNMVGIQNELATATEAISVGLALPATTVSTNPMEVCAIWARNTGKARVNKRRASAA